MGGAPQRVVVKCDKHGLHYDSATQSGCVICRREQRQGTAAPGRRAGIPIGLGIALLLIALASLGLYIAHASQAARPGAQVPAAGTAAPAAPLAGIDARVAREAEEIQRRAGAAYAQEPDGEESH